MLVSLEQFGFSTKFHSDDLCCVDSYEYPGQTGVGVEAIVGGVRKKFEFPNEEEAQQFYNYLLNILNKKK